MNPRVRQVVMQGALVVVFAAAVGLAALVTRRVRMSMRVELGEQRTVGRLMVRLPAKWQSSPAATVERGDAVEADEPPGEQQAGRRLRVTRQRSDGLISPLEHLLRSGQVKPEVLKALAEGREGYSVANLTIGGWPGQMVTMLTSPRAGVLHKDVIGCATMPSSQAVVIHLEGLGPIDASDQELVRQMGENVGLTMQAAAADAPGGGAVELVDEIRVDAPSRYVVVPNDDPNQLQRQLLFDGSWGSGWVAVDLASCVYFAEDREEALGAMLVARDPDWRSGPVKRLGARTLTVERVDALGQQFPSRAYLTANGDGRALLVVMRGGPRDGRMFDAAWQSIAASVKFAGTKDLSALLAHGAEAARGLVGTADGPPGGLGRAVAEMAESGSQDWSMWDASENADQELWSQFTWQVSRKPESADVIAGTRTSRPVDPYSTDTQFEQRWSAAADLSRYQVTTYREVRRPGNQFSKQTLEQSAGVEKGRLTLGPAAAGAGTSDVAVPEGYVPGALLPLVLRGLAERPALVRTESFVGVDTIAPQGLLTLFVTRLTDAPVRLDEKGEPMDCVTVSVNGTGTVSRWYYGPDARLRFVDFAGGLKAQGGAGK